MMTPVPAVSRYDPAVAARNVHVGYGTIWRFFAKQKITSLPAGREAGARQARQRRFNDCRRTWEKI
jgi:hypothetical protein